MTFVVSPSPQAQAWILYGMTVGASCLGLYAVGKVLSEAFGLDGRWPSIIAGIGAVLFSALLRNVAFFFDSRYTPSLIHWVNDILAYAGTFTFCAFCVYLVLGVTPWAKRRNVLRRSYDPRFWRRKGDG